MWTKLQLYFFTLRYLRFTQVQYRLWYTLRGHWRKWLGAKGVPTSPFSLDGIKRLELKPSIPALTSYQTQEGGHRFAFLHLSHLFTSTIDWNFNGYGKLWTYNLNYFEFLQQDELSPEQGLFLIKDFIRQLPTLADAQEPFPTSLRLINWIKFLTHHRIEDHQIDTSIGEQLLLLTDHLEYHLLGNHLLENAYALLFGAYYTQDAAIWRQATDLLKQELEEQILADGGHFELSPMYHQLMLYRLLDCINLVQQNQVFPVGILDDLIPKASRMLAWLQAMTFASGQMPRLNDSATKIAPTAQQLFAYAEELKIPRSTIPLSESGYRKLKNTLFELIVDVGQIGPDYIPGHAHSDTLSFVLEYQQQAFIVDIGISTYEKNARRQWERGTAAHNTVQIGSWEQSEVWGGFRVARRARPKIITEEDNRIMASHNGYARYGVTPTREWQLNSKSLYIRDIIKGQGTTPAIARFYLAPDVRGQVQGTTFYSNTASINFKGAKKISLLNYDYPQGYNQFQSAQCLEVSFKDQLETWISQ